MADQYFSPAKQEPSAIPFRNKFDGARDPLTARNAIGALGEAPADGQQYAREDGTWTAISAPDAATVTAPQGRLTLQTATPVMTTSQSAKTTIYYSPCNGVLVPLFDGSSFTMTTFSELSVATTDTAKSPAAIGAGKINDWFVWSDSGTLRVGHGPDWTSNTARSAGTDLVKVNGLWLNNAALTNGPAAQRGTYVGTTISNASSQLNWIFGGTASGGTAGNLAVWNCYNRVTVASMTRDSVASTTISAAVQAVGAGDSCAYVCGLAEDAFFANSVTNMSAGSGGLCRAGIGIDTTGAFSALGALSGNSSFAQEYSAAACLTSLGYHVFYMMAGAVTANAVISGLGTDSAFGTGIIVTGRM